MLVRPSGAPEQVFEWEIPEDKVVSQEPSSTKDGMETSGG